MKLIVSGSRNGRLGRAELEWLRGLPPPGIFNGVTLIITGGAGGVDLDAYDWAIGQGIQTAVFDANWVAHGKSAGPRRNAAMAQVGNAVALFPGGVGTADMEKACRRRGLGIWRFEDRTQ